MTSEECKIVSEAALAWLCDSYSIDVRFIAAPTANGNWRILSASVSLNPVPFTVDNSFQQVVGEFLVGQKMTSNVPRKILAKAIENLVSGVISVYDKELVLEASQPLDFYSESLRRDLWFFALHLRISGDKVPLLPYVHSFKLDNALRNAAIPFDGVEDLANWLGIADPTRAQDYPSIVFRMNPPADLLLSSCKFSGGNLDLTMLCHPRFSNKKIGVAIRSIPGRGLLARKQVANELKWAPAKDGIRVGKAAIPIGEADQVIAIVSIDGVVVRRQWLIDPTRARNQRLVAIQQFDSDLKKIKRELFNPNTSDKFELAVASLFFLIGFNPVVQLETDSPDLVVMTPEGRLAIVECTTRVADGTLKIGKLVDRRAALVKTLSESNHSAQVLGVLVCALPRDQMAIGAEELKRNKIVLMSQEDLAASVERLRFPDNPDQIWLDAHAKFSNPPNTL